MRALKIINLFTKTQHSKSFVLLKTYHLLLKTPKISLSLFALHAVLPRAFVPCILFYLLSPCITLASLPIASLPCMLYYLLPRCLFALHEQAVLLT